MSAPKMVLASYKSAKTGLTTADAAHRQFEYGKNRLERTKKDRAIVRFLRQLKDLMIILLIISSIISLYLGDRRTSIILLIIVVLNASIGYFQEHKAERLMESLEKLVVPMAKVIRNGTLIEVASEELVPGDIIRIDEGDSVPADARLIEETELFTNDFALTGESNPSKKFTHEISEPVELPLRHNLVFMGTTVARGNGVAVVIATGMDTELGRIASLSQETKSDLSPLQKEMNHLAMRLTQGTILIGGLLVLVALQADLAAKEAFIFAIGIASAMIPQGLPAEINVSLAQAANKLANARALVKKLSAVETLGATSIILTDKTGTLTKNEMTVQQLWIANAVYHVTGTGYETTGEIQTSKRQPLHERQLEELKLFFATGIFASNASIHAPDKEHANWYCLGDPTEGALITLAHKAGIDADTLNNHHKELREFPFDSGRKRMSSVRHYNNQRYLFSKGAPENILAVCTHIWMNGRTQKLTNDLKKKITAYCDANAKNAMRNLAYAFKPLPANSSFKTTKHSSIENELTFLGIASMIDPPRDEVSSAMLASKNAHIPVAIITGDNALTAKAIALKAGLAAKAQSLTVITDEELRKLSDHQVAHLVSDGGTIFSRVAPEDKLRIVQLTKHLGKVVAVTGDGINDAPALKRADIGVAMGKTGTDVAKQSSDIVLLDDSFHTLVGAIQEGRVIFQNIRKTILSCITSNFGELTVVLISLALSHVYGIPLAITAVQILAIDLVGELFPLAALGWDPPEEDVMHDQPRELNNHIFSPRAILDVVGSGLLMGGLAYGNYLLYTLRHGLTPDTLSKSSAIYVSATTITYVTIILCQFANILSRRTRNRILSGYLFKNKHLIVAFAVSLCCVAAIVYVPFLQTYLNTASIDALDWLFALYAAVLYLIIRQGARKLHRIGGVSA